MSKVIASVFLVLTATAAMLTATASTARADEEQVVAKVPFDFMVGKAHLPAGSYTVREASIDGSIVSIANVDGREGTLAATIPIANVDQADQPQLVFEKVNNQYYLARVVSADGGREIATMPAVERHFAATARH